MQSDIESQFKKIKQNHYFKIIFGIICWVLVQFFLIFIQISVTWSIFLYFLLIFYILLVNFQLRLKLNNILLQDINLKLYRFYLENLKSAKSLTLKYTIMGLKNQLEVIEGNFEHAQSILENRVQYEDLHRIPAITQIMILRQSLIIHIYQSDEKMYKKNMMLLQSIQTRFSKISKKRDKSIKELAAIHDLVMQKQPNPYFETATSKNKLSYLRNLFYKALNAQLSQDRETARAYFQELAQENAQLYIVRRAKEELEKL